MSSFLLSLLLVILLYIFGPLLYRITQLPSYDRYREVENSRRPSVTAVDGGSAGRGPVGAVKYFFPEKRLIGAGWGNIIQEEILNALLAYSSNRSLVYPEYTWRDGLLPFDVYYANKQPIPARIPLSVFIDGPIVGQPSPFSSPSPPTSRLEPSSTWPLAISASAFRDLCEEMGEEIYYVDVEEGRFMWHDQEKFGLNDIVQFWAKKLEGIESSCVSTGQARRGDTATIWEYWIFDVPQLLEIWPTLKASPILTQYSSSPLVLLGLEANKVLIGLAPSSPYATLTPPFSLSSLPHTPFTLGSANDLEEATSDPLAASSTTMQTLKDTQYDIVSGLLVLHVRRGDYETHCPLLATKGVGWQGMNRLATQGMPDDFDIKSMLLDAGEDRTGIFQRRCFPSIDDMVARVRAIRDEFPHLDRLYIMTNGKSDFLSSLNHALLADSALHRSGLWTSIHTSRDLILDNEQRYVAQAVDMAIGIKADVLIGNGWSSLTSHIVMMRMSRDVEARRSRMW